MKLFVCAVAVCLIAVSYCADKKPGETCTKDDKCTLESECKKKDPYCDEMECMCEKDDKMAKDKKCVDKPKPKASKDEACAAVADCLENSNLKCTDKKCKCPTDKPNFTMAKVCTDKKFYDETCTTDADCMIATMVCKGTDTKKCACKPGKKNKDSNDKECSMDNYAMYDEDCTTEKQCNTEVGLETCPTTGTKKCKCPSNLEAKTVNWVKADNTQVSVKKCLHANATVDAGENDECSTVYDASDKASYCKKDLACHVCGTSEAKCLKIPKSDPSGAEEMTFSVAVVLGCVALRKFFM